MQRVLHINDYPIDAGGGAEVVMSRTIALLREHGFTVETFTCGDLEDPRRSPWRYIDNVHARNALAAKLYAFRPEVVHLHNYYHLLSPAILTALADFKHKNALRVVMTAHDYHLVCPNAGGSWFRWGTGRREALEPRALSLGRLLSRCWDERTCVHSLLKLGQHLWNYRWHQRARVIDFVICPSRFVQEMLAPIGLKSCWLPHPAPPAPNAISKREGRIHLVFAGRVEPEKGLCEFLQALPDDFQGRLTIVGDGSDRPRCQAACVARRWGKEVEFVGRLPHAQTLARIAAAHVLVQPSRVLETYGLTLIEALAVGANLLVSDRGAAREIVGDAGVGFLYDVEDAESLRRQLRCIQQQHADGQLNRFSAAAFLQDRSEAHYLAGLLRIYTGAEQEFDRFSGSSPRSAAA